RGLRTSTDVPVPAAALLRTRCADRPRTTAGSTPPQRCLQPAAVLDRAPGNARLRWPASPARTVPSVRCGSPRCPPDAPGSTATPPGAAEEELRRRSP